MIHRIKTAFENFGLAYGGDDIGDWEKISKSFHTR